MIDEPVANAWDNAAMESFFPSLKTERTARKVYRTRDDAKADVFDYIERFYNPRVDTRRWPISAPCNTKSKLSQPNFVSTQPAAAHPSSNEQPS